MKKTYRFTLLLMALMIIIPFVWLLFDIFKKDDNDVKSSNIPTTVYDSKKVSEPTQQKHTEKTTLIFVTLKEYKVEAAKKLGKLGYVDPDQLVDFLKQIDKQDDFKVIDSIVEEASKINDANKESQEVSNNIFQKAIVSTAISGDSIMVNIDDSSKLLSLIGIRAPEIYSAYIGKDFLGIEAYNYVKEQLGGKHIYIEKDIYVEKDTSSKDKINKLQGYVWLSLPKDSNNPTYEEIRDHCFNGILLREGFASVSPTPPNVKYSEWFSQIENEARVANKGIWNEANRADWDSQKTQKQAVAAVQSAPKQQEQWIQTTAEITSRGKTYIADTTQGPIKGNKNSMIYHIKGQQGYNKISVNNVVWFNSIKEAEAAGYRPALK